MVVVLLLVESVGALLASFWRGFLAPPGLSLASSPAHGCATASGSHLWLQPCWSAPGFAEPLDSLSSWSIRAQLMAVLEP